MLPNESSIRSFESINFAVIDAIKLSKSISVALKTTHEVTKLIKYSSCHGVFHELKSAHDIATA